MVLGESEIIAMNYNFPIRVLHVLGNLNQGGAESRIMDVYRAIDKLKVQFDFMIHTSEECYFSSEVRELGGRIYSVPRFNGKNLFSYRKAWDLFFNEHSEYKIIHGHITSTAFIYLNIAKKHGLNTRIAHARSASKSDFIRKYTSKLGKRYATHLFAVSNLAAISEFGNKTIKDGSVKIIPNAINTKKYLFNEEIRKKKRIELNIENKFVIANVGSFRYAKNHTFIIDIFKEIKKEKKNAVLLLIGDGELREQIKTKVSKLKLDDSVFFAGLRSDVPELLQAMDVLLFPSIYEGLPGVVLEAQAAGLPCVISDAITKEVAITPLVKYISLSETAKYWANEIISSSNERLNSTYTFFVENNFDIGGVKKFYEEFYLNEYDTKNNNNFKQDFI